MSDTAHFDFRPEDEERHDPGPESAWNESLAFCAIDTDGSALFLRHGWRWNEGHTEATVAWIHGDGSLDVCFRKEPIKARTIADRRASTAAGLDMRLIEPMKRWRVAFSGKVRRILNARQFAVDPGGTLKAAPSSDMTCDLTFDDTSPLFSPGPGGTVPGAGSYISSRHYESSVRVAGTLTLGGTTRRIDTFGFRDHSWGVRDMTRAAFTRWIWVQVDARTSAVGWFTGVGASDLSAGIIVRDGVPEVATSTQLASSYEPDGERYVRSAVLTLGSPRGDVQVHLGALSRLPLRYQNETATVRIIECPARHVRGNASFPAWMEYIDAMVDGHPAGNGRA